MNISTGGPHILLFERDQQLTGLLISEFQLAGYECHTARTAVEVFDAIARQPIRLILVNLAQAAAARREFWVALDTQRRGRGVQVLTFHCTNIANYGPKDPDEHVPTMVDLEVDGMTGIMNLVDAVRTRVPVGTSTAPESTLPRILRSTGQQQANPQRPPFGNNANPQRNESTLGRNFQTAVSQTKNDQGSGNENATRMQPPNPTPASATSPTLNYSAPPTYASSSNNSTTPLQANLQQTANGTIGVQTNTQQNSQNGGNAPSQPTYTEKIRAVLYPNQRTWSPSGPNAPIQENRNQPDNPVVPSQQAEASGSTVLQRLASGQIGTDGQWESGLAQLSRMVQERNNPKIENNSPVYPTQKAPPPAQDRPIATPNIEQLFPTSNTQIYMTPATPPAEPQTENLSMHTMRASPIQDLPGERGGTETNKRPDLFTRTNYTQQTTASQPALASLSAATQEEQESGQRERMSESQASRRTQNVGQEVPGAQNKQAEAASAPNPINETAKTIRARIVPEPPTLSRPTQESSPPFQNRPTQENSPLQKRAMQENSSYSQNRTVQENSPVLQSRPVQENLTYSQSRPVQENSPVLQSRPMQENPTYSQSRPVQENSPALQSRPIQENPTYSGRGTPEPTQPLHTTQEQDTTARQEQTSSQRNRENTTVVNEEEQSSPESRQSHISMNELSDYKEEELNKQLLEKAQAEIKVALGQRTSFDPNNAPSNALLLDIMQSLPPMPAPTQQIQAQVLSGRATRSLGSVLLEGHLVPQNRLEVAQNVQRMLRGVDLNYQLGEILLMFKLLTPDQLLAASLVSYGMINPTQITALGRIRQELHAIGLEYDLENLLIMFRILTTDQLREVRASW